MPFNPPPAVAIPSEYLYSEDEYECSNDEFCEQLFEEQCQFRTNNDSIEGFDMSVLPKEYSCTFFLAGEDLIPYLTDLSQRALEKYNRENGINYQFVKYVKAIFNLLDGFVYYIMFEAQQPSENAPATFTTFADDGMQGLEFKFVYMVIAKTKRVSAAVKIEAQKENLFLYGCNASMNM